MTTYDEIETRLRLAVAVDPTDDGLLWLDQRVAQLIASPPSARGRGIRGRRPLGVVLLISAALLLLAGAVAGAMGLFERTVAPIPGWSVGWDKAEVIGASETDAGLTLTLERAYADLNQVIVFVSVEGLPAPRVVDGIAVDHLDIHDAELRDPSGRRAVMSTGIDAAEADLGVAVRAFQFDPSTSEAGTYTLAITSIGFGTDGPDCAEPCSGDPTDGTWRFEFELPAPAGTVVAPDLADANKGAVLRLTELRISPTRITARIDMFMDQVPVAYWEVVPGSEDLMHDDKGFTFWSARHVLDVAPFEAGPTMELSTNEGVDDPVGSWKIVIPAVDYALRNGDEPTHLTGPWTFVVDIP